MLRRRLVTPTLEWSGLGVAGGLYVDPIRGLGLRAMGFSSGFKGSRTVMVKEQLKPRDPKVMPWLSCSGPKLD